MPTGASSLHQCSVSAHSRRPPRADARPAGADPAASRWCRWSRTPRAGRGVDPALAARLKSCPCRSRIAGDLNGDGRGHHVAENGRTVAIHCLLETNRPAWAVTLVRSRRLRPSKWSDSPPGSAPAARVRLSASDLVEARQRFRMLSCATRSRLMLSSVSSGGQVACHCDWIEYSGP